MIRTATGIATKHPRALRGKSVSPLTGGDEVSFSAHAKVILLGEHAVVHGGPAIALPVGALRLTAFARRSEGEVQVESSLYTGPLSGLPGTLAAPARALTATLEHCGRPLQGLTVRVEGEVPSERGLGSSAAVAAAISGAVAQWCGVTLGRDEHFELVQIAERVAHGNPSGLDARAVAAHTPIWFHRGEVRALSVRPGTHFVIADTGITGNTREAVSDVAALKTAEPERITAIIERIGAHTEAAVAELERGDLVSLGSRMFDTHELLRELTVSSPELDHLVEAARQAGALGAKLTGGGRGGCVLALAASEAEAQTLAQALQVAGARGTWILNPEDLAV